VSLNLLPDKNRFSFIDVSHLILMKTAGIIILLIILVLSSGCTAFFSNLQTPQKNLGPTDSAVFAQEKTNFVASISSIALTQRGYPRQVTITIQVKNTGKDSFSLIGYPRFVDSQGREYTGTTMMFGGLNRDGYANGRSVITIPTEEEYTALLKGTVLKVKFQSMKPLPYEGIWNVDLSTI
jgi:hypothetical protein